MISCYIEAYTHQQTNYEEQQRLTDSQACTNSTTSVLTLGTSERLYQPINLFTYFYLHAVQNSFMYDTDYKLGHKPILIWRLTHDTKLKITLGRVCIGLSCARACNCSHITECLLLPIARYMSYMHAICA